MNYTRVEVAVSMASLRSVQLLCQASAELNSERSEVRGSAPSHALCNVARSCFPSTIVIYGSYRREAPIGATRKRVRGAGYAVAIPNSVRKDSDGRLARMVCQR